MRDVVPEQVTVICDFCGVECAGINYRKQTRVTLQRSLCDHLGDRVGLEELKNCDTCDNCGDALYNNVHEVREKHANCTA